LILLLVATVSSTQFFSGVAIMALTAEWIQLHPSQTVTPRRSGHAAFVLEKTATPYVFGGYVEEDTTDNEKPHHRYVVNDLWQWKTEADEWTRLETTGDIPGPRLATAMASLQDKVYLFGGWDPQTEGTGGVILDTVHELDLSSSSSSSSGAAPPVWKKLAATVPGGPTSRHVAVALPDRNQILIHNHRCRDLVLLFDPATGTFREQATTGPCPSPRGLHAACAVSPNRICVFGGAAQDQTMSNEAFVLDTVTWEWTQLNTDAASADGAPSPRASPCIGRVDEKCVVIFGGAEYSDTGLRPRADVWALDLEKPRWTLLLDDDEGPPPRNAATFTEITVSKNDNNKNNANGKAFLLTGGWAPFRETWDDCYVLKVVRDD